MSFMANAVPIQDTYPEDACHCYGCGTLNEHGFRIKTRLDGETTITDFQPGPQHIAFTGVTYGGLIASVIDCHSAGSAAIFAMRRAGIAIGSEPSPRFVTAHLEVDYLAPTPLAQMRIVGRLVEMTDRKAIVESDLLVGGDVTARGSAVLVRVKDE
ncbi:MAG: PaaI family thioesterase [Actinobacteria bacterium]|nr:MAG: PaaI family thioesterase [Actinomycetota bacterium]